MNPWFTVYDKREQAFVFEARRTQDEASDYFRRLWNAGMGLTQVITEVQMPCSNVDIQACITKALSRWNSAANDVYPLQWPLQP